MTIDEKNVLALRQQSLRFLIVGAANTLVTYLIYCALLYVLHPQLAYLAAYLLGIALAYWGNSKYVFRVPMALGKALIYPAVYVVQYACTASLIYLLMTYLQFGARLALAVAIVVVVPISFLLNRKLLS